MFFISILESAQMLKSILIVQYDKSSQYRKNSVDTVLIWIRRYFRALIYGRSLS